MLLRSAKKFQNGYSMVKSLIVLFTLSLKSGLRLFLSLAFRNDIQFFPIVVNGSQTIGADKKT